MTAMHRQPLAGAAADRAQCWRHAAGLLERERAVPRTPALPRAIKKKKARAIADECPPARAKAAPDRGAATEPGSLTLNTFETSYLRAALADISAREFEVLVELCAGGRNEDVARRLFIALPTLRTHLSRLNEKLGTLSKSELIGHVGAMLVEGYRAGQLPAAITAGGTR
jgi:DNA-binding CsgD family transcriptional regulator